MGGMAGKLAMTLSSGLDFVGMGAFTGASGLTGSEADGTNVLTGGQLDFSTDWAFDGWSRTAGATQAPNGLMEADLATVAAGSTSHRITLAQSLTQGYAHTLSFYVKKGTATAFHFFITDKAFDLAGSHAIYANFDLETGTIGYSGVVGGQGSILQHSIAPAVNGFYKCTLKGVPFTVGEYGDYGWIGCIGLLTPANAVDPSFYDASNAKTLSIWRPKLVIG